MRDNAGGREIHTRLPKCENDRWNTPLIYEGVVWDEKNCFFIIVHGGIVIFGCINEWLFWTSGEYFDAGSVDFYG